MSLSINQTPSTTREPLESHKPTKFTANFNGKLLSIFKCQTAINLFKKLQFKHNFANSDYHNSVRIDISPVTGRDKNSVSNYEYIKRRLNTSLLSLKSTKVCRGREEIKKAAEFKSFTEDESYNLRLFASLRGSSDLCAMTTSPQNR
ncbi:hypothetical protein [Spartinivicinus ruber]|uniref:hypothetical protein n=1 Tax=Spartinivicinus ruber TaxID=2683272 RepID=UPI0013D11F01|nr:hypothetical protein [Spartinivicinus ruber]